MQSCRREMFRRCYWEMAEVPSILRREFSGLAQPASRTTSLDIPVHSSWAKTRWSGVVAMARRVDEPGGLRVMGITNRSTDRASVHVLRGDNIPTEIKERQQDETLQQAREKQAAKIGGTEQAVAAGGESLAAADMAFENFQAEETPSKRGDHADPNGMNHTQVDEEVRQGLMADSEHPIGRVERADEGKDDLRRANAEAQKYELGDKAHRQSFQDIQSTDGTVREKVRGLKDLENFNIEFSEHGSFKVV